MTIVTQPYEARLRADRSWAMDEGDRHFQRDDAVFATLRKVVQRLDAIGVPYAVVGALALDVHGYRRLTVDVDLLVTRTGLARAHEALEGLGYRPMFAGGKYLRDAEHGVRVEFLVAGDFPGDSLPKPVAFPAPDAPGVAVTIGGIHYLALPALTTLKLASGMTNLGRLKDLADVQELVRELALPAEFADQLDPFVRAKYAELWASVQDIAPRDPHGP